MKVWAIAICSIITAVPMLAIGWKYAADLDATISPCVWGVEVIDGDTIKCNGRYLRLMNVDTAEIDKAACASERELAIRTKSRLSELVADLDYLPRKTGSSGGFGRWQTVLWVNGVSVADILVGEGLAVRSASRGTHDWCRHPAQGTARA